MRNNDRSDTPTRRANSASDRSPLPWPASRVANSRSEGSLGIQVGESSREPVELPAAALRSSALQLMGSGLKSVPMRALLAGIGRIFDIAAQGKLHIDTRAMPLSSVAETWNAPGNPRVVYTTR